MSNQNPARREKADNQTTVGRDTKTTATTEEKSSPEKGENVRSDFVSNTFVVKCEENVIRREAGIKKLH